MAPTINQYNLSQVTDATGNKLVALMQYTSQQTNYLPGFVILLSVYVVVFLGLKAKGASTSATFAACNMANLILTILLYPLGVVSGQFLVVGIVLVPLSVFLLYIAQSL
jgi:hypothetical protein